MTIEKKKAYDPTVSFMFFGTWVQSIETLEAEGIEQAYRLFKAIANYCMYEEDPDFSDNVTLSALWKMVVREADLSIAKRKSQFDKDEFNDNHKKILDILRSDPTLSHRKIAAIVGVSPSTVDRVHRKYKAVIDSSVKGSASANETGTGSVDVSYSIGDNISDSVPDSVVDIVYDTMTQRNDAVEKWDSPSTTNMTLKDYHDAVIKSYEDAGVDMSTYDDSMVPFCDNDDRWPF